MTPGRLIDATPVRDEWWLIRIAWTDAPPAPGQWLWFEWGGQRVCLPVRDANACEGWVAGILPATHLPDGLHPGALLQVSALQGQPISIDTTETLLIVGEGPGIGPAIAVAESHPEQTRLVLVGSGHGIPGRLVPSRFFIPPLADVAIAGLSNLEALGVPSRIALTNDDRPGVHEGPLVELLSRYLSDTPADRRGMLRLIAVGPWRSLQSVHQGLAASTGALTRVELPIAPAP